MKPTINWTKWITAIMFVSMYVGCSEQNFNRDATVNSCQNSGLSCVSVDGIDSFDYSVFVAQPKVDILFVDDNSGSMSFEQTQMASRFPYFMASIDDLDYRIAVTTTDVSTSPHNEPRAINLNGQLQDGKLIPFSDGRVFLDRQTPNLEQSFNNVIQRPETVACEAWLQANKNLRRESPTYQQGFYDNCPSSDERGIYASILTLTQYGASFLRPDAHLAIIFISDEGNRSFDHQTEDGSAKDAYLLEDNDLPGTLVSTVQTLYPQKSLRVHSIIVRPGDTSCLKSQSSQLGKNSKDGFPVITGEYGTNYAQAATLTNGVIGDVCANDYKQQIGEIAAKTVEQVSSINLTCGSPSGVEVNLFQKQDNVFVPISIGYSVQGGSVQFNSQLPDGVRIDLKYSCPRLN